MRTLLRARDPQRKAGPARDVVITLARKGRANACSLTENEGFVSGPSQLELRRYERLYRALIWEEVRSKQADAPPRAAE